MIMFTMRSFFSRLFGAGSRLSALEILLLDCVRSHLNHRTAALWDRQILAINKVQRLPEGIEVNFFRMKNGRPSFDDEFAFPNEADELLLAIAKVESGDMESLTARVWCVNGFLFSIEYKGNVSYFEEAAGMEPPPDFTIDCELVADLED